ncbi:hypothetical protein G9C85_17430 [Halorubellus sp. JP-L1]|uniref:hypothetical protein n=1 Tax=Halorubellus sp. JP-L1 TaxID=2715753 RepID=UPI001408661A|nr:hypothetical protein [Halorubellus sp. JP-L1]NHN43402.1 hypothetical protein [Halorubellus sp. JP-L1]
MTTTIDFGGSIDGAVLALVVVAALLGSAAYFLVPTAGDAVYYGLMTVGVLSLAGLLAKQYLD